MVCRGHPGRHPSHVACRVRCHGAVYRRAGLVRRDDDERLNHGERTMYVDVFGGTHLLGRYIDDSWQVRSDVLDMLISDDPFEREALRAGIATTDPKLVELTRQMGQADTDREDVNTLADIDTSWRAYTQWRDQALASVAAGDRAGALASYRTDGLRLARITDAAIDAFMKKKQVVGVRIAGTAEATYEELAGSPSCCRSPRQGLACSSGSSCHAALPELRARSRPPPKAWPPETSISGSTFGQATRLARWPLRSEK